ncbi:MAG: single-stranded-DNA-specific exonuclease RecJ, partial [Eubacteriales bacterium]|nr:single-stranded-DNA-specific exonuclease RecJ [Eubacteriales bacterium]
MLIQKEWRILDSAVGSAPLAARVFSLRQLNDDASREHFLNPTLDELYDPFLLPDMAAACSAVKTAVEQDQLILVHGDYDVDGLTSTALLVRFLRRNGIRCEALIPDRLVDGYGLSEASVTRAKELGANLLITVDCGVTSVAIVAELETAGVAVVITDHHECPPELPQAHAVINPKRADSHYPTTSLCGVGVTYKFIQAIETTLKLDALDHAELALVALGTVADVVPLTAENRIFVREGLKAINRRIHPGLTALLTVCSQAERQADTVTIGYSLAPRLNAAGRLGAALPALELLLTDDPIRAAQLADDLQELNRQRQVLEANILAEAIEQIEDTFDFGSTNLIILARAGWHTGVVGIVCSRLVDLYQRPVIVLGGDDDRLKGSARTCGHFDILEAIRAGAAHTRKFGGHRRAAGLEIDPAQFEAFCSTVNAYAATQADPLDFRPESVADVLVEVDELNEANAELLAELAPFGEGNRQPLLVCENLLLTEWRLVGNGKHIKLAVAGARNKTIGGIAFNLSAADDLFAAGDRIDLLFALEISQFQGRRAVQLQIRDLRPSQLADFNSSQAAIGTQKIPVDFRWLDSLMSLQPSLDVLAQLSQTPIDQLVPEAMDYTTTYQYLRASYPARPVQTDLALLARR